MILWGSGWCERVVGLLFLLSSFSSCCFTLRLLLLFRGASTDQRCTHNPTALPPLLPRALLLHAGRKQFLLDFFHFPRGMHTHINTHSRPYHSRGTRSTRDGHSAAAAAVVF
uniref:Putative secreted protein n=1 Tax=Anopheles darlingi TaxID=43151 RepID=A0A2M4D4I7_ANODA